MRNGLLKNIGKMAAGCIAASGTAKAQEEDRTLSELSLPSVEASFEPGSDNKAQVEPEVKLHKASPVIVKGELGDRLDSYFEACSKDDFSASVLIVKDGEAILQKGYGLANREQSISNTPDTLFEIASLSKQFTAAAILKLAEQGKLSVEDSLSKHLDGVPEAYKDVTLYHLLTHTGGIVRGAATRGLDKSELVKVVFDQKPLSLPGKEYSYSNSGYALLAAVVSNASGTNFESYLHENIFRPAGMTSTGFCGEPMKELPLALGYKGANGSGRLPNVDPYMPENVFGYEYIGMGGVVTSIVDIAAYHEALSAGKILNAESLNTFFTPSVGNYASGWEVFTFPDGRRCVGHGGSVAGYACKDWQFPDDKAAIVILSNRSDFNYGRLKNIYSLLFNGKLPEKVKPAAPQQQGNPGRQLGPVKPLEREIVSLEEQYLDSLAGTYRSTGDLPLSLNLTVHEDGLVADVQPSKSFAPVNGYEKERELVTSIIDELASGSVDTLSSSIAQHIPPRWAGRVLKDIWPNHVAEFGRLKGHTVLGVEEKEYRDKNVKVLWLQLEHAKKDVVSMIALADNKVTRLYLNANDIFGGSKTFHPRNKTEFTTERDSHSLVVDGEEITITPRSSFSHSFVSESPSSLPQEAQRQR